MPWTDAVGDTSPRTVREVFAEEQPPTVALPDNPFAAEKLAVSVDKHPLCALLMTTQFT